MCVFSCSYFIELYNIYIQQFKRDKLARSDLAGHSFYLVSLVG